MFKKLRFRGRAFNPGSGSTARALNILVGGIKMKSETEQKICKRKPASSASCVFYEHWWNDPEQRNYVLEKCSNEKNTGGRNGGPHNDYSHDERTYSCWHKNEGMKYRCWEKSEKIMQCEMALCKTKPEVVCEKFVKEQANPTKALVLKEEIRERFYEADGLCAICRNCFENSNKNQ